MRYYVIAASTRNMDANQDVGIEVGNKGEAGPSTRRKENKSKKAKLEKVKQEKVNIIKSNMQGEWACMQ